MKYLYVSLLIFVLSLSGMAGAEDTSDVTSHQSPVTSEGLKKTEEKKNEDVPSAIQEDFSAVPSIVSDSLQLYREQGAEAFIKSILKGGPLEGDEGSARELERMRVVERYFGKMQRHSFFNILKVTPFFKRIFFITFFVTI